MEMLIVKVTKDLTEEKEKYLSQVNIEKERREK